uniref:Cardioactive peptide Ocp-1/Ocp-2 n=1 Tax=Callistoctopus minor TaxID=515824 RepID=OCP1_CALMC
GFGD